MKKRLVIHNHFKARDASPDQVEARYQKLRGMERAQLEKQVAGRLSPSHLRSEPKSNLVNAALNAEFSRKDIEAWQRGTEDPRYPAGQTSGGYDRSPKLARDGAAHVLPIGKVNGLHIFDYRDYGNNRYQVLRGQHGPVLGGFKSQDAAFDFARKYKTRDHWYNAGRVNGYQLLEGAGTDGGDWGIKVAGQIKRFSSRAEAVRWAEDGPGPEFGRDVKIG